MNYEPINFIMEELGNAKWRAFGWTFSLRFAAFFHT